MGKKQKEIESMSEKQKEEKLEELKMELLKNKTKPGKIKNKEIKKAIARILYLQSRSNTQ